MLPQHRIHMAVSVTLLLGKRKQEMSGLWGRVKEQDSCLYATSEKLFLLRLWECFPKETSYLVSKGQGKRPRFKPADCGSEMKPTMLFY